MDMFFQKKRNVVITAVFYTFLWGCAFPLVKLCMEAFQIPDTDNMSKCLVAGMRFACSGILTLVWCACKEETGIKVNLSQMKSILLYGILATSLQYSFTYIGLSRIDGSKGAVYDQMCVFVIVLTSGIFFREDRLNLKKIMGCIMGFAGVLLINAEGLSFTVAKGVLINTAGMSFSFDILGEGVMLCAVLFQTIAYFVVKSTAQTIPAPKLVGYGQLLGGIVLCLFSLACGGRIYGVNGTAILTMGALVLISAVAYVLSLMPLKYFPASEISSFNLLISVFGVVMSSLLLKENIFRWNYGVSLLLIAVGILLINARRKFGGKR